MAGNSAHCSPSRSSLSCCQADNGSQGDVRQSCTNDPSRINNNYFMEEKHQFPKRPEVDLQFRNVRYRVKSWSIKNLKPVTNEILHSVSGEFRAGELTAIMGPSGAGKSTLLNLLAGYTVQGMKGEILVNGKTRIPHAEAWRRTSCYIQQYSVQRPRLTVGEAMNLAAHLKLGCTISSAFKHTQVLELLEILGLSHCYDTLCGKLSGGQKKRLDVALELLSNPSVLFLDEPTTGLDSASCSQCIALLQRLARIERRTVVCTIHQPSALQFEMFDSLYALADGHCIYRGPVSDLVAHLAALGLQCPAYHNPADFLLEVAIGEYGISTDKLISAIDNSYRNRKMIADPVKATFEGSGRQAVAVDGAGEEEEEEEEDDEDEEDDEEGHEEGKKMKKKKTKKKEKKKEKEEDSSFFDESPPPAGFLAQCYLLYKRQLVSLKRDYFLLVVRLLCHLLIGIIFGYLYMGSGYRANGVLANYVYLYGSLLLIVYTGKMAVTLAFPLEMQILTREHFNRWYGLAPYYISILLIEVPFQAACAATYLAVSYWLTGQPVEAERILMFMIVSIAASLCAQAWGFFIGATTPVKIAVFVGPIIAVLFSVFGFCIRYMDTPTYFRWIFHISYFRASFHSLLLTVYGNNRTNLYCEQEPGELTYCHYMQPTQFLKEMEIVNTNVLDNLAMIVGIGVLMHLLTASALWCKLNRR